jgi:hypothetical protein
MVWNIHDYRGVKMHSLSNTIFMKAMMGRQVQNIPTYKKATLAYLFYYKYSSKSKGIFT